MIRWLIKTVFSLGILAGIGLAGFAYFGDLSPETSKNHLSVTLNAD